MKPEQLQLTEKKAACQNGAAHEFIKRDDYYQCRMCDLWKKEEELPSYRIEVEYLPCKKCNGDKSFYCDTCNGSGIIEQETVFPLDPPPPKKYPKH